MKSKSTRPIVLAGSVIVFLTFGVFGGWAAVAKLDSAVVAPGTITLDNNRKVIQHLEGGIVEKILVSEGAHVESGEVLLRLSSIEAGSNLRSIKHKLSISQITEARLLAERKLADSFELPEKLISDVSAELNSVWQDQKELFADRRAILTSQTDIFKNRIKQTQEQIKGLEMQRDAFERRVDNYQTMIDRMISGEEKGLVQTNILSQRQDELIEMEANFGRMVSEVAQAKNSLTSTEFELLKVEQEYRQRANTELEEVRATIAELEERLKVATDIFNRTEILAPATGSIQNLKVHTVGSVVRPGDELMQLVPDNDDMIISARVSPTDVDNVSPGLKTEVRFSAFKTRLTPIVLGQVETISKDVITPSGQNEQPYFLARIVVPEADIPEEIRDRITAGMPVDTVITTGERTMVTYLSAPVVDAIRKSLVEE